MSISELKIMKRERLVRYPEKRGAPAERGDWIYGRRPVLEVAMEVTGLPARELKPLLDPALLAQGGIHGKPGGGGG